MLLERRGPYNTLRTYSQGREWTQPSVAKLKTIFDTCLHSHSIPHPDNSALTALITDTLEQTCF